jgi:nitrous oxide reductase
MSQMTTTRRRFLQATAATGAAAAVALGIGDMAPAPSGEAAVAGPVPETKVVKKWV